MVLLGVVMLIPVCLIVLTHVMVVVFFGVARVFGASLCYAHCGGSRCYGVTRVMMLTHFVMLTCVIDE